MDKKSSMMKDAIMCDYPDSRCRVGRCLYADKGPD